MKYLIITLFILNSTAFLAQEKRVFFCYDVRENFSSGCSQQTSEYGVILILKNENLDAHYKIFKDELKKRGDYLHLKKFKITDGNKDLIAIVKSTQICKVSKKSYDTVEYYSGKSKAEIQSKLSVREEQYKTYKLRHNIIEVLNCDEIFKNIDKNEQVIVYKQVQ